MGTNIFRILRMEQDEVVMCRFLADLLDPRGWHERGTAFLESFLRKFVKEVNAETVRLESTCVMKEYLIDNGRRIDIMLQNPAFSVPIEVKINAGDQQGQCYDYDPYAQNAKLIYLTKDGHAPSEWSRKAANGAETLPKERVRCVSWGKICDWLEAVPEAPELVQQFAEAIRSFLEEPRGQADKQQVCAVLEAFRREMGQGITKRYGLVEPKQQYHSYLDWDNESFAFCPGLNYWVDGADFLRNGLQMWFRIEVSDDGYLAAGFCLVDTEHGGTVKPEKTETIPPEEIRRLPGHMGHILSRDNWWFVWRFSNGRQDVFRGDAPNFKTMNQCAINLLDEGKRMKFVQETMQIFEDQLLGYLKPKDTCD